MREKVSLELKLEALQLVTSGESFQSVSKRMKISDGELKTWSLIYAREGEKGLAAHPKNVCVESIKWKIIRSFEQKAVPLHHLSAQYHVPYSSVVRCISTYRRKGKAGITGAVIHNYWPSADMEKDLSLAELKCELKTAKKELEYLRAENAYLKKLKALMDADTKRKSKPSNH